ncbi:MAG: ABC-type transport auxiliary lipoprotein family protein [Candidatus Stygibacter frigidus]|nr:ABC-type transport auxiliary lipoprotein family protein [Candidatus Stygibacter frigidus]
MKNNRIIFLLILITLMLVGCSVSEMIEKQYYIFDYNNNNERPELFQDTPLPYSVMIQNARISQTYTRKQIVIRHYGPQIRYMTYNLWGIRLQDAIPDIFSTRLEKYGVFDTVNRDMLVENPNYQIIISINNLEIYETASLSEAHLNIEFTMVNMLEDAKDCPNVDLTYKIDRTARIEQNDVEAFVQKVNDMILEESNNFIVKILNKFTGFQEKSKTEESITSRYDQIDYSAQVLGDSTTVDESGIGLVYLPNLSGKDNEPFYYVKDKNGYNLKMAHMGEEVPLPKGNYTVEYGSQIGSHGMSQRIDVKPRWRLNVEPDWGCLIVDVMDEQRNYAKVSYTIYDNADGFDYGIDYPADVNLGEKSTIWVLKPGTYKVTLNNESFNTYRDFTTIEVLKGYCQNLSLIVQEEENSGLYSLIGAGVINEEDDRRKDSNWNLSSAIHVNINLNSDNSENRNNTKLSINMNAQLDNSAYYEVGRLKYSMKNLMEIGTNKDEDYEQFRVDLDDIDVKNTVIFNVFSAFGLYGRFDLNTHFFPVQVYDVNYIKKNTQGAVVDSMSNAHSVETSPSFFPMTLKEGFGLNFQVLNTARSDMNLRFGLGARQDIRKDVYSYSTDYSDSVTGITYEVYTEEASSYYEGIEASMVGDLQLFGNINYSLTADFLFPFAADKNYTMDIENILNIKLFKYISLDYRLKFYTRESEAMEDYISTQQSLFLRFTYLLR